MVRPHCFVCHGNTWQNLDGDIFEMLYKSGCWAAIPDPIWVINVPHERKINMLSCSEISSVMSFFSFEKFWVKSGLPSTQLNRANTQNLEKINFDMFYRNDCWAVICYPICVTNVSYEREIIVLSGPVIRFVILIFVFLRFEIKSGFPFYWLTLYREVAPARRCSSNSYAQGIVSRRVVMVKQPRVALPQLSPLLAHWTKQTPQDLFVHVLVNPLVLWQEMTVDDAPHTEWCDQHDFDFGVRLSRFLWPWRRRTLPLKALAFGFQVVLEDPSLYLLYHSKTRERDIVSSPYTCCSIPSASDGVFPNRTRNFKLVRSLLCTHRLTTWNGGRVFKSMWKKNQWQQRAEITAL